MAVQLTHKSVGMEGLVLHSLEWDAILNSAKKFGWKPKGTISSAAHPKDNTWDRYDYYSKNGQIVLEDDAKEFAHAIDNFLRIIRFPSIEDIVNPFLFFKIFIQFPRESIISLKYKFRIRHFSHSQKEWETELVELVKFCRQGEFSIF